MIDPSTQSGPAPRQRPGPGKRRHPHASSIKPASPRAVAMTGIRKVHARTCPKQADNGRALQQLAELGGSRLGCSGSARTPADLPLGAFREGVAGRYREPAGYARRERPKPTRRLRSTGSWAPANRAEVLRIARFRAVFKTVAEGSSPFNLYR
jgi:hypothetical protein